MSMRQIRKIKPIIKISQSRRCFNIRELYSIILLGLIVTIGFYLRANHLTQSPPGFYIDEASIGYNAYSILKTGRDEHGVKFPLFFQAFGDYKNPVYIYSLVPLVKMFDLEIATVRLNSAIWGTLGILAMFWMAWEFSKNKVVSLLAAAILAVTPWHLHYSRLGFEAISFPTLLTTAISAFMGWKRTKNNLMGMIAGLSLTLAFFSYSTARLWLPLVAGFFVWLYWKQSNNLKHFWPLAAAVLMIGGLLIYGRHSTPDGLTARLNQISIWSDHPGYLEIGHRFWNTFWQHWTIRFLFLSGDPNLRHSSQVNSELLLSLGAISFLGAGIIWNNFKSRQAWKLVLLMIGLFPLAASLTKTDPIATRTLQAVPFFSLAGAVGIRWMGQKLWKSRRFFTAWLIILALTVSLEFGSYYYDLINRYPVRAWNWFDGNVSGLISEEKTVLPDQIHQIYIQGLFFMKADPVKWQTSKQAPFIIKKTDIND